MKNLNACLDCCPVFDKNSKYNYSRFIVLALPKLKARLKYLKQAIYENKIKTEYLQNHSKYSKYNFRVGQQQYFIERPFDFMIAFSLLG